MNAISVGEKRSGKTTLALDIALNPTKYDDKKHDAGGIIVFDPKKEFRGWPATVSSIAELEKAIRAKHRVIIWRPPSNIDVEQSWDELADWILEKHDFALSEGWDEKGFYFTVIVDEAYNLQSHNRINAKLLRILSQNRPEVLNVIQTFQSVKNVNSDSRSRVSDWYLFTITLQSDLDRLEEFAPREVIGQVKTLPEHTYVHFLNEKGTTASEIVTDSDSWFESLNYEPDETKENILMPDRETDPRDEFPADGILIHDRAGLDEAHAKFNRRKADDPKNKYRQRKSDNQRESKSRDSGSRGKAIEFGSRKSA